MYLSIYTYVHVHNLEKLIILQIMTETSKNPLVLDTCHAENRLQDLQSIESGLEKCQKSLNDYLDSKRNAFPRFFFISDDELLSILGSHECTCVQEHVIKASATHEYMGGEVCLSRKRFNAYILQSVVLSAVV